MNMKEKESRLTAYITILSASLIVLLLLLSAFWYLTTGDSKQIEVKNGILDMESWDFEMDEPVSLTGQWEFYWKQFLTVSEMADAEDAILAEVPGTWDEYSLDGQGLPGQGYGTYRLHVKTGLVPGKIMGFRIQTFSSAYRLYVDDRLLAENGNASGISYEELGEYKPQTVYFSLPSNEFDIIIHVSNHQYVRGGFWSPIHMGSQSQITELDNSILMKNMIVIGAFLIVALFYIASFFLMKDNKANLYFALLCIFGIIAYDTAGQLVLTKAISSLSLDAMIFMWYSSSIWAVMFVLLYMNALFESRFSRIAAKVFLVLIIAMQTFYIFAPIPLYTAFGQIANYIEISALLCAALIAVMALAAKKKNSGLNLLSITAILVTVIHDVLYYTNVIKTGHGETMHIGFFIFLLIQMLIKAIGIKDYFEHKNAAELKFLQAQIKPHFLYNALSAIISISREDQERSTDLLVSFSNYLRGSFNFKSTDNQTLLRNEMEHVNAYLEIEKARYEERIEFSISLPEHLDYNVPVLVLQPIVENAIVHGLLPKSEGGKIEVSIMENGSNLEFLIKDNGVGMDTGKILQEAPDDTKNGIALANIDSRLRKIYGSGLRIVSGKMVGTEVGWRIPIRGRGGKM
ncbi:MAG TPA: histidine kinase [Clostridia bacterium]|nr:histidine kinase [Clostridia bacterium]